MGFERGHPKYGGKRKGSPGSKQQVYERAQLLALIDATQAAHPAVTCNPFQFLLELMMNEQAETGHRLTAAIELSHRLLPKLAAVKVSGNAEAPLRVVYEVSLGQDPMAHANGRHPSTTEVKVDRSTDGV